MASDPLSEELVALGRKVIESRADAAAFSLLVRQYIDLFGTWFKAEGLSKPEKVSRSAEDLERLRLVQVTHGAVLKVVAERKVAVGAGIRTLRKKGKGIIAYIDKLPKTVSVRGTRKG